MAWTHERDAYGQRDKSRVVSGLFAAPQNQSRTLYSSVELHSKSSTSRLRFHF